MILKNLISNSWTLFLDRDGVINERLVGDYIKHTRDFRMISGVGEAIKTFSEAFGRIVVVTNQQGIGRGLMTEEMLNEIHQKMLQQVKAAGGRIDGIYHCSGLAEDRPFDRKPNVGMALKARKEFPEIRFKKSVIAGDSRSDLLFGRRLGMTTVLIGESQRIAKENPSLVDYYFPSLIEMATEIKAVSK
ncbi:MAG: HAD-IIIA family hydrolase [Bacteroidales bacterium]|jgi:histidinol-phosphate phosphatase family protein|nr:HAD-IIIA family hydrolase [Bacteroidales bacterium]NCU35831.1 HAD-IIIA family hydrolase [Candidatus Falkowbacteria bacterium]MDD2631296.1 HAD-IIIA family hydrolase [Bacteroidales bacterium]MDD3527421.1 HAD-IIIA family hydrolase [Bacteroidales bacterium]MDD4176637.1 HAD-IIIA family hydrolase [Bacteroidales bacterium]